MGTHTGSVMTLANSIIGVSVLAMPFCFKQCGIILSIFMLILSNVVTRLACYYLIKSAIMEKRKNFEMLAFRVLGRSGKLIVELCIIGFMLGTCVAFFVVVGDLGPTILAEVIGVEHPSALRPSILIGLSVFVVLPLGLLRNVESLTTLCAASIGFYVCLVLKVMGEAASHLLAWDWMDKVSFWRPAGVLQCIPIFSMALSCQTQLFEVFDSLPSTPMERMNSIIRSAINMTTTFYIAVGFFGYVAFCNQPFTGNLLINLSPSVVSYIIKLGFVLSVAVSFPLVIFPCRASIYSLIFTSGSLMPGGESSSHIPETKFQCITLLIVTLSLVTGMLVPSIEAVLGFVGSTIGFFVCIILPSIIFVCLSKKNTSERLLAKMLAAVGVITMVLSTYANITAVDTTHPSVDFPAREVAVVLPPSHEELEVVKQSIKLPENLNQQDIPNKLEVREEDMKKLKDVGELKDLVLPKLKEVKKAKLDPPTIEDINDNKEVKSRQEPPNPVPDEPKSPPKKKKTVLVPPLSKIDIVDKVKTKIDIEEIKRKIEKLDLPKSAEAEKVEDNKDVKISLNDLLNDTKSKVVDEVKVTNELLKKSGFAENIANGVPLPLVVKENLDKTKINKINDREKRDTNTILALDKKDETLKSIKSSISEILKTQEQKGDSLTLTEHDDTSSFVKEIEKEVQLRNDKEKCPKNKTEKIQQINDVKINLTHTDTINNTIIAKIIGTNNILNNSQIESNHINQNETNIDKIADQIVTETSIDNNLIKTPAYLSDPNLIIDSNKIIHGPEPKLNLESNPLKRDLKSIVQSIRSNPIEHR